MEDRTNELLDGERRAMGVGAREYIVRAEADEAGRVYVETNKGNIWPTGIIAPSFRCRSNVTGSSQASPVCSAPIPRP